MENKMIIAVDIGNTNITFGCYRNDTLLFVSRIATDRSRTEDQYAVELKDIFNLNGTDASGFDGAIISSVVPELNNIIKTAIYKITNHKPMNVCENIDSGLNIEIDNPSQLGADLIAGAVAAINKYDLPCLVVDLGTATKISVIDKKGIFKGCTIAAGVGLSLNALSTKTSQLPAISLDAPSKVIGTNTIASMKAGTVLGTASMIDGLCDRIEIELNESLKTVVATGGHATDISPHCLRNIIYDSCLILDGLKCIYDKNTQG